MFKLLKWAQKELKKEQKEIKYTAGRKKVDQQKSMKAKTVKINYRNQNSEHIHGPGDLSKWKRGKDMDDIIGKKILKNTKKEDQGKNPWASVVTEKNVLNKLITETALLQQKAQPAGQQDKFGSLKKWSLDTSGQIFNWVCLFNQVWHSHNPRSTCYLRIVEPAVVSPGSKKKQPN